MPIIGDSTGPFPHGLLCGESHALRHLDAFIAAQRAQHAVQGAACLEPAGPWAAAAAGLRGAADCAAAGLQGMTDSAAAAGEEAARFPGHLGPWLTLGCLSPRQVGGKALNCF
jgi:hypothetical protein